MSIKKSYYTDSTLEFQLQYFGNLPEKQRRYFLAYEYLKLGRGSQRYLAKTFGCSRQTIVNGLKEVRSQGFQPDYSYQRRSGAGPKKKKKS
jgi:hypothetical protein